ncbi:hypothetical protein BDN72DRAFT_946486 [Pluteus cervinus]|uniref:Uncharacterized protein n=1 Tax=Pluteus cervinus TaxID=181527 RepID=A0ACD3A0Q9_9AGAR|nr:hypothetical protein BDN72DRAFT_946486 [Pluteus cervinus]
MSQPILVGLALRDVISCLQAVYPAVLYPRGTRERFFTDWDVLVVLRLLLNRVTTKATLPGGFNMNLIGKPHIYLGLGDYLSRANRNTPLPYFELGQALIAWGVAILAIPDPSDEGPLADTKAYLWRTATDCGALLPHMVPTNTLAAGAFPSQSETIAMPPPGSTRTPAVVTTSNRVPRAASTIPDLPQVEPPSPIANTAGPSTGQHTILPPNLQTPANTNPLGAWKSAFFNSRQSRSYSGDPQDQTERRNQKQKEMLMLDQLERKERGVAAETEQEKEPLKRLAVAKPKRKNAVDPPLIIGNYIRMNLCRPCQENKTIDKCITPNDQRLNKRDCLECIASGAPCTRTNIEAPTWPVQPSARGLKSNAPPTPSSAPPLPPSAPVTLIPQNLVDQVMDFDRQVSTLAKTYSSTYETHEERIQNIRLRMSQLTVQVGAATAHLPPEPQQQRRPSTRKPAKSGGSAP